MSKQGFKRGFLIIMTLLLISAIGYSLWRYNGHKAAQAPHYAAAVAGTLKHEEKVRAVFANEETLLEAETSGNLTVAAEKGQRVRKGEVVLKITPSAGLTNSQKGEAALPAPCGGLFWPVIDGVETIYTPDHFLNMDLAQLLGEKAIDRQPGSEVQAGEIIGKIVNNLAPTVAFVEVSALESIVIGKTIQLELDDKVYSVKVLRKSESPLGVVVQFSSFLDQSLAGRNQELTWLTEPSKKGVIIPRSALWLKGEEQGVLAVNDGIISFRKVIVLDQNEQELCLDNFPVGMLVVTNPREGMEGQIAEKMR